jgi:hypothetical protein
MTREVLEVEDNPRFFDLVGNMRAMRRLRPDPVPDELLFKVLNAGVQAPSGMNTQPWSFLVLREPDDKLWFAERYKAAIESRFGGVQLKDDDRSPMARQFRALQYQMGHLRTTARSTPACRTSCWRAGRWDSARLSRRCTRCSKTS